MVEEMTNSKLEGQNQMTAQCTGCGAPLSDDAFVSNAPPVDHVLDPATPNSGAAARRVPRSTRSPQEDAMSPIATTTPSAADHQVAQCAYLLGILPRLLADARATRGLTITAAANQLHTTKAVLTRWEAGNMLTANLTQILTALQWIGAQ